MTFKSRAVILAVTLLGVMTLALSSYAQVAQIQETIPLVSGYDLASTSYIYCVTNTAPSGTVWGTGTTSVTPVTTSGSSTTVTAVTSGDNPFVSMSVGDEMSINLDGVITKVYVTAKASSDSITVNTAVNLGDARRGTAGYFFNWRKLTCSTAATAGWIPVRGRSGVAFSFALDTINATSIDARVQCRHDGSISSAIEIWTKNYTVASGDMISITTPGGIKYDECRFGMKVNTDTGVQSITVQVGG
jgi:hypothetical protein